MDNVWPLASPQKDNDSIIVFSIHPFVLFGTWFPIILKTMMHRRRSPCASRVAVRLSIAWLTLKINYWHWGRRVKMKATAPDLYLYLNDPWTKNISTYISCHATQYGFNFRSLLSCEAKHLFSSSVCFTSHKLCMHHRHITATLLLKILLMHQTVHILWVTHSLTFNTWRRYMFPQYGKSDHRYVSSELASWLPDTVLAKQQSASWHVSTAIERAWAAVPVLVSGLCSGSRRPGEAWWWRSLRRREEEGEERKEETEERIKAEQELQVMWE